METKKKLYRPKVSKRQRNSKSKIAQSPKNVPRKNIEVEQMRKANFNQMKAKIPQKWKPTAKDKKNMKEIENWFKVRGREVRPYEIEAICQIENALNGKPVCLAACPGAGKTVMSEVIIERYLDHTRNAKAIVSAHGTNILKSQYAKSLAEYKPWFSWSTVEPGQPINKHSKVIVAIPHTLHNRSLKEFKGYQTLLVVDEAHHLFNGEMVQEIIRKVKPKHVLLLTGTPSPFVLRKWPLIVVPMLKLIKEGYLGNVSIELAEADYTYGIGDLNEDQELSNKYKFNKEKTSRTLDNVLKKVQSRIKMDGSWEIVSEEMCKTMLVCRNVKQAQQVHSYFKSHGVSIAISTHDGDKDSMEIERFMNDRKTTMLVVVYRGILGFDFNKLCNIIDLSGSGNIDRIFQLMARLVRRHNHDKVFYKVIPTRLKDWYRSVMNATMFLIDEEGIRMYNGKNFKEMSVLTRDIQESDLTKGAQFGNVIITNKTSKKGDGYTYDIEKVFSNGKVSNMKAMSGNEVMAMIGKYDRPNTNGPGPGNNPIDKEKWTGRREKQIPLDLISFEFFMDALMKERKFGIYARTTINAVRQMLGYSRQHITYEECRDRFKAVLKEIKKNRD